MYFESKELQFKYEQYELSKLDKDLKQMREKLKPARRVTFRAENAGIERNNETEIDYQIPEELCLAKEITEDKRSDHPKIQ